MIYPFEFAAAPTGLPPVGVVLTRGAFTKICAIIIKAVAVFVIGLKKSHPGRYLCVHKDFFPCPVDVTGSCRIPRRGERHCIVALGKPFPLREPFVIPIINDGGLSLCKGYSFHVGSFAARLFLQTPGRFQIL